MDARAMRTAAPIPEPFDSAADFPSDDWPTAVCLDPDDEPVACEGGAIAVMATAILLGLAGLGLVGIVSWIASWLAGAGT